MMDPLFGIWQFFVVWALGLVLIRWIRLELPTGYRLALAFGLGEMTVSYFLFLLGMVGGLRFSILVPLAVLITLGGFPRLIREMRHAGTAAWPYLRQSPWLSLGVAGIFGLYALSACTPEREVDSVWYHLGVPLYYITHGGSIQLVPFNMPSHYPMNLHLHYCFSLLVGNEVTAKFFILFHFLPIFLLLWAVIARYAGARWGLWGILLYCCCMHFRIPVMANVERAVYFHVFLSTALLWMALEKKSWRLLLWASVFCGMAMGTKFNGHLFGYAAQWLLLAIAIFGLRAMPVGEGMWKWIVHTLVSWLMVTPWLIKSYIYTNNPFYPMLGEVFATKPAFQHAMLSNANNHGLNLLKSSTPAEFLGTIGSHLKWFTDNADLIFFLGLVSLLVLLGVRRPAWRYPLLSGGIAYGFLTMMWGCDIARLFAANYGMIVVLITILVAWLVAEMPRYRALPGVLLLCVLLSFFYHRVNYIKNTAIPLDRWVVLTEEARRDWLDRQGLFSHDFFIMGDYIRENIPAEDELYGYRTGYLFYFYRKTITCGAHFGEQMDAWLLQGPTYTQQKLQELGVKWVFAHYRGLPYDEVFKPAWERFADQCLEQVHQQGETFLYRLRDTAPPS